MPLVLAHIARSLPEAQVTVSAFEAAGIPAFPFGSHVIGVQPALDVAFGGVRVMVSDTDYEAARALLDAREPDMLEPETTTLRHDLPRGFFGLLGSLWAIWCPWWVKSRRFRDG